MGSVAPWRFAGRRACLGIVRRESGSQCCRRGIPQPGPRWQRREGTDRRKAGPHWWPPWRCRGGGAAAAPHSRCPMRYFRCARRGIRGRSRYQTLDRCRRTMDRGGVRRAPTAWRNQRALPAGSARCDCSLWGRGRRNLPAGRSNQWSSRQRGMPCSSHDGRPTGGGFPL